jgi:hypothetical protein
MKSFLAGITELTDVSPFKVKLILRETGTFSDSFSIPWLIGWIE